MSLSRRIAQVMIEKNISVDDVVQALQKYNLVGMLPSIKRNVIQMTSQTKVGDTIMIEAPFAVSEHAITHIKNIIGNTSSPHEVTINKNILAGFKARYKGKLYDGSAERIIRQLIK